MGTGMDGYGYGWVQKYPWVRQTLIVAACIKGQGGMATDDLDRSDFF